MSDSLEISSELRRLFQSRSIGAASEDCPDASRIRQAALDRCRSQELRELLEHTAICPNCAAAWRLARDLGEWDDAHAQETGAIDHSAQPASIASRRGHATSTWRWRSLAAAAAVLIAMVGIWLYPRENAPVHRAPAQETIQSLVPGDRPLTREDFLLRWSPCDEETYYSVRLSTADFASVITAEGLDESQYRVPAEILDDFESGTRFIWQVDAFLPSGQRTISETFSVVLE